MRALLQRVSRASVRVGDEHLGQTGRGLVVLLGVGPGDDDSVVRAMVDRIANLRIFDDAEGKTNLSAVDVGAEILLISQFTLYADTSRGRRPGFTAAAPPTLAEPLVQQAAQLFRERGFRVVGGRFGTHMQVELVNDGPMTIALGWAD